MINLELTPHREAELLKLEQETGQNRNSLLLKMFDSYMEKQREHAELKAIVERGRADIAAGRCTPHHEAMAQLRAVLREKVGQE